MSVSDGQASLVGMTTGTLICKTCGHPRDRHGTPPQCPPTCATCGAYLDQIDPECATCMAALEHITGAVEPQFPLLCGDPVECPVDECWRAGRCQRPR